MTQMDPEQGKFAAALEAILLKIYTSLQFDPIIVKSDLEAKGIFFQKWDDLFSVSLLLLDAQVQKYIDQEKVINGVRGIGFGSGGFLLMLPDLEELIRSTILLIQKISFVYGFDCTTEAGKKEVWRVFALCLTGEDLLAGNTWEVTSRLFQKVQNKIEERITVPQLLKYIAKKVAWRFAKKRIAQVIPFLGSAVAGYSNYRFIEAKGMCTQNYYRSKHLFVREQHLPLSSVLTE